RRALSRAFARVAPLWPLDRMVAVNPYFGLREHTFTESTDLLRRVAGARATMDAEYYLDALASGRITTEDVEDVLRDAGDARCVHTFVDALGRGSASAVAVVPTVATVADVATRVTPRDWVRFITERVSQWASAYFDDGQARWRAPSSDREGLFAAWREEALIDRTPEIEGLAHFRRIVASLPRAPEKAAAVALDRLAVPPEARDDYLHRLFMRVAGWAAHCARIAFERDLHEGAADHAGIELGTVMLVWEVALLEATGDDVARVWSSARGRSSRAARGDDMAPDLELMQAAFERAYQRRLQRAFPPQRPPTSRTRPAAQAVFCIDVRSEVFRRHLETVAPEVETSGFAGFFGFPIAVEPIAHARPVHQCPVLLSPSHRVPERRATDVATERATTTRTLRGAVEDAWTRFKMGAVSCFSFVGPVGLAYLPKLVSDGLGWTRPVPHPREEAHHHDHPDPAPLPLEERVDLAAGALRGMSLHRDVPLARLVVITGHGSTSVNNPHASALDCGACGGRSGAPNARFAAAVLNDPEVRAGLDARGVTVPEDTIFVAALHDTTRDEVTVLSDVPASHAQDLVRLQEQLAAAGARSRVERAPRMGIAPEAADEAIDARSRDWAQTRPEWGLAGFAA
ncbi:MAG: putative inorganic carbon transporter subunit DabA, partial [Myxococcota bacterium]